MSALVLLLALAAGEDVAARLEAGEIIVTTEPVADSNVPRAKMQGVIEAPPEQVWAIIEKCGDYVKTMPRVAASKELSRDGGMMECEVTVDTPFPLSNLTSRTQVVMTIDPGVRWERSWKLLSGDYKANEGHWLLTPYQGDPNRTHARYEVYADPKIHVPQSLINSAQARSLPKLIQGLRDQTQAKKATP
jgi:ribosome-associated toxin RatA of RatAB toxin-antitoxin module